MSHFTFLQKTAVAAAAILVVTGCTTESSSSGCSTNATGFTGTAKSELGEGRFEYTDARFAAYEAPVAVAERGEFTLSYDRYAEDPTPLELRSASPDRLVAFGESGGSTGSFRALGPGVVAVLAVSTKDPNQVVDLVHVRILTPTKIRIAAAYDFVDDELPWFGDKASIIVHEGDRASLVADVLGEVDEARGPLGEHPVGELVELGGIAPKWETTDAEIISVDLDRKGTTIDAWAKSPGTADVTITAGALKKTVHVTVKAGVR